MLHLTDSPSDLQQAAQLLRDGRLVAFPTETVYGLGANALDPSAVARVFAAKGRPADHPLIVHLADASLVDRFARDVPETAHRLASAFWPGALTLILWKRDDVPDAVTGGQPTIGLRVPSHPIARALLAEFGGGVAAPSANSFGRVSPTTAQHVLAEFDDSSDSSDSSDVAAVIDGGACSIGIESTIVDLTGARPRVLRPGGVSVADVERVLGAPLDHDLRSAPRVSGSLASHYAPRTPVELVDAAALSARAAAAAREGLVVVINHSAELESTESVSVLSLLDDPIGYAHDMYAVLRAADSAHATRILIERPPTSAAWAAVLDRLTRAAGAGSSTRR